MGSVTVSVLGESRTFQINSRADIGQLDSYQLELMTKYQGEENKPKRDQIRSAIAGAKKQAEAGLKGQTTAPATTSPPAKTPQPTKPPAPKRQETTPAQAAPPRQVPKRTEPVSPPLQPRNKREREEAQSKPGEKETATIPPSPPVSGDWINAQLRAAAKGDRKAVDSIYQRSIYLQDFFSTPGMSHSYFYNLSTGAIRMEFGQNEFVAICATFDRMFQNPAFQAFMSIRTMTDTRADELYGFMKDPANTSKSLASLDPRKQGNLVSEAVASMRAFFYNAAEFNTGFKNDLEKIGYGEEWWTLGERGWGVATLIRDNHILPDQATPQLMSASALYLARFDSEGKARVNVPQWKPPAIVERPRPDADMEPTARVDTSLLTTMARPDMPKLAYGIIDGALKRPHIIWAGTSISSGGEEHRVALQDLLTTNRSRNSAVVCRWQKGAGVSAVRRNMEEELTKGNHNTVVFEAGVNDLWSVVNRISSGELKSETQINDAVDKIFALTVNAAKSALSKGKVVILLTVSPWGGYATTPDQQEIADKVTARFNIQLQRLHDPGNGIFLVDTRTRLGDTAEPRDLRTNPPANWPKDHRYTPSNPNYWLRPEFRGLNDASLPPASWDARSGYLHMNAEGHRALGDAVADQVYRIKPPNRKVRVEETDPMKQAM